MRSSLITNKCLLLKKTCFQTTILTILSLKGEESSKRWLGGRNSEGRSSGGRMRSCGLVPETSTIKSKSQLNWTKNKKIRAKNP